MVERLSPLICFPVFLYLTTLERAYLLGLLGDLPYPAPFCCFRYFVTKSCSVSYFLFFLRSSTLIDNMMTRGKSRFPVVPATSIASGACPQKRPAKSSTASLKRASCSKRARTTTASPVTQAHPIPEVAHPSQLERVSLASVQPVQQSTPLPDIAGIISGAVIEGLKAAGISTASSQENANQAASVQGSVAAVIQNITGE